MDNGTNEGLDLQLTFVQTARPQPIRSILLYSKISFFADEFRRSRSRFDIGALDGVDADITMMMLIR
jgi:hypothetical protein